MIWDFTVRFGRFGDELEFNTKRIVIWDPNELYDRSHNNNFRKDQE